MMSTVASGLSLNELYWTLDQRLCVGYRPAKLKKSLSAGLNSYARTEVDLIGILVQNAIVSVRAGCSMRFGSR
jgi:hypothetical protein